jgi:hypothetical protein
LGYRSVPIAFERNGASQLTTGAIVTANYFDALGVEAVLGRTFDAASVGRAGEGDVAVISHNMWLRDFHADPAGSNGGTAVRVAHLVAEERRKMRAIAGRPLYLQRNGPAGSSRSSSRQRRNSPARRRRQGYVDAGSSACAQRKSPRSENH